MQTRPPSLGRTNVKTKDARFSRGFKRTLVAIGALVILVAVLPFWLPPSQKRSGREAPLGSGATGTVERSIRNETTRDVATRDAGTPDPASTPVDKEHIPELPTLSATEATPALLARATELALEHPGISWLQQYVVNCHFWLARNSMDERHLRDALGYLDGSEQWGTPSGDVASYRAIIYRDQHAWKLAEQCARAAIDADSKVDAAEMHHIIGKARYFREELDGAIEEFEKALAIRDAPHIRASLELAMRDARTSDGFSRRRLSHFIVRYEGETMEDVGRMAIDALERDYASLASQLGFQPEEPVSVILYTRRSYGEISGGGWHWSGGLFDGKIRLPVQGVHWGDEYIRRTLHHELTHAFFYSRTGGHDPRWLNEGLAEYAAGERTTDVGDRLAPYLSEKATLEDCLLTRLYDCRVFYPASASLVDYMIQMRGMGGIRDVLSQLGEGLDIDDALHRVVSRDERGLVRDWEHFVRRRH